MKDDALSRFLIFIGSFGTAEILMWQWSYVPEWRRGFIIMLSATLARVIYTVFRITK